jgi:hypothetical protein
MAGLVPAITFLTASRRQAATSARVTIDDNDRRLSPDRNAVLA